ncbi:MAG: mechanosensitive ion channel family protein [Bdellovibrionaceae bacterium]|nr:mechanosensitive ion channel family protein [Pseudobdellovibrionaceae bacterium]
MDSFFKVIETDYILMPTWKWFCLVILLLLFPFFRRSVELFLRRVKKNPFFINNKNIYIVEITRSEIERPFGWIISLMFFISITDMFQFPQNIDKYLTLAAQILIGFRWLQLLIMGIDIASVEWAKRYTDPNDIHPNQIIPFAVKTAKFFLVVLGVLIVLQNLGINVVSILAGLGIGGIAIALAGQETVANLFGSLTILVDKPFKINDYIKVLDVEGTVIEIGFRSTKIRTPVNSIVTISNSTVAKEKLENLSARTKRRIRHNITLAYETPLPMIKAFTDEILNYLKAHPQVDQDEISGHLISLSAYSVDIQITFFTNSPAAYIENAVQQDFLFQVLAIAEKMKIEIAYPTQKLFLQNTQSQNAF